MRHVGALRTVPRTTASLSVSLVGRVRIRFNGRVIELRTQKASAVLSYLALTEAKQESRQRLIGLLWSRSDEEKARASLRQVVRELRTVFEDVGYGGFSAGRLSIHLNAEKVEVDIESIIRLAESGSVHPLLLNTPHLGERILDGMDDIDPSFRSWVLAKRQEIHDRLIRGLSAGLVAKDTAADVKTEIATAIVNLDPTHESERLRHIADLLGGPKVVGKYPTDPLATHEMLERGLPNTAIKYLLEGTTTLEQKSIESAIGMSVRTRQRREKHPTELLSQDQAGRTWKFAEILTRAIAIFGSRNAAEQWLAQPATGLDQRRPIDLLTTPAGMELVEDFLGRIEYGVYP
jgi:putative toxin-antitoxin system antitoxin component (TIGR02293 family)